MTTERKIEFFGGGGHEYALASHIPRLGHLLRSWCVAGGCSLWTVASGLGMVYTTCEYALTAAGLRQLTNCADLTMIAVPEKDCLSERLWKESELFRIEAGVKEAYNTKVRYL